MAIDLTKVKVDVHALAGQSAPLNMVDSSAAYNSGTGPAPVLVDVGGKKAWEYGVGTYQSTVSAGLQATPDFSDNTKGLTYVVQFCIHAQKAGGGDFHVIAQAANLASGGNGAYLSYVGALGIGPGYGADLAVGNVSTTQDVLKTIVLRVKGSATFDQYRIDEWHTGGGGTSAPDQSDTAGHSGAVLMSTLYKDIVGLSTETKIWISREVLINTVVSDADCAALVADIDAALSAPTAPTITGGPATPSVPEGTTTIGTYTASEAGTWGVTGADAAKISISAGGVASFSPAQDFDIPDDVGGNNVYNFNVTFTATSSGLSATPLAVAVTLTNVNEAPTYTGTITVPSLTVGVAMTPINTSGHFGDPDAGDTRTYSLLNAPSGIVIDSATAIISGTPAGGSDASSPYTNVKVRATDAGTLTVDSTAFTITVGAAGGGVTFAGTVPAKAGTAGTAFAFGSPALSSYFTGAGTYAVQSGNLTALGLSLDTNTGVISGSSPVAGTQNIVIRKTATSGSPATADTNSFAITIAAAPASSVALTLTAPDGTTPRANLTGLKWAFFDQVTPDLFAAPTAKGAGETTDGAGVLALNITGTALAPGAIGWLDVTDSDGTITQSPSAKAFSGPVVVA